MTPIGSDPTRRSPTSVVAAVDGSAVKSRPLTPLEPVATNSREPTTTPTDSAARDAGGGRPPRLGAVGPELVGEANARIESACGGRAELASEGVIVGVVQAGTADFPRLREFAPVVESLRSVAPRVVLWAGEQAVVYFVYNDTPVDSRRLADGDGTVRFVADAVLYEIPRDLAAEELERGRHVAEVLVDLADLRGVGRRGPEHGPEATERSLERGMERCAPLPITSGTPSPSTSERPLPQGGLSFGPRTTKGGPEAALRH